MQIRTTISQEMHIHLQEKAQQYGLTMSGYLKHLIIQDIKVEDELALKSDTYSKKKLKSRAPFLYKGLDLVDG